jgi:hypothetical protein
VPRVFMILSTMFAFIALGLIPRAEARPEPANKLPAAPVIKVGIMSGMFKGFPDALIKAGGQQFGNLFQEFTGFPGAVEAEDDYLALAKKLNENKLQLGVVHGFEWAWLIKQNPQLETLAVTVPARLPQACIVVNAKNPAIGPEGLKGANIDIPFNMKAHGFLYIDKLHKASPAGSFRPNTPEDLGPEEALEEVSKGKAAAALVDAASLAAYQANNPGKAGKVRILCQSEPFPPTTLIYNKGKNGLDPKTVSQIKAGLLVAAKNPKGKAFLFMWNLKGFEEPTAAFDKLVAESVKAYPPPERK